MESPKAARVDRWPWVVAGVLLAVVIGTWIRCFWIPVPVTTVFVVRHAERQDGGSNPPLSSAGTARAATLAHVLRDERITAVFVTEFVRTQQTGAPAAAQAMVTPIQYLASNPADAVNQILANHAGGRVLVVGHSNTVDDIAAGLGATGLTELADNQFDRLLVIHRFAGAAHLDRLRYGAETP